MDSFLYFLGESGLTGNILIFPAYKDHTPSFFTREKLSRNKFGKHYKNCDK